MVPLACPDLNAQEHVGEHAQERSAATTYPVFDRLISAFEDYLADIYFKTDFMTHDDFP